jgi:hypothetical protein
MLYTERRSIIETVRGRSMKERRLRRRFIVEGMDIHGRMIFATNVSVLNISAGGISLKADRRLDIGREYSLKLVDGDKAVSVRGTVVWSSISGHRDGSHGDVVPIYAAGLKFTGLPSERMTEIVSFIGEHVAGDEQRLGGLRVRITDPEKAILNYPSACLVKNLSLSGMLIEGTQEIVPDLRLPMEISLPDDRPIRFIGRITFCRHVHEKGLDHFDIGVAFMNMEEKDIERLKEFISLLHRMDNIA